MSHPLVSLQLILSKTPEEWNGLIAERNPKEEWLKFEPFNETQGRYLVQVDSRKFYSDEISEWRDLGQCQIEGVDFSGRDLSGVNFSGSVLTNVFFRRCGLRAADFSGCTFENVDLTGALLFGARFVGATFNRTCFSEALIYCSNFGGQSVPENELAAAKICASSRNSMRAPLRKVLQDSFGSTA